MPEPTAGAATMLNNLPLQLGIAVLLLAALVIFSVMVKHWIKSENAKWKEEMSLREKKNEADKEMLTSLIDKNYAILTSTMNDNREQIKSITRLVERVKTMQETYDLAFRDLFQKHEELSQRTPCVDRFKQLSKQLPK